MIYNTRFNPTVNGYLHLGHLFVALVNQAEARASGGTFGVRFDDDQRYWHWLTPDIQQYKAQMRADLLAFGVYPDYWHSQTEMKAEAVRLLETEFHYYPEPQAFAPNRGAASMAGDSTPFYPYVPEITCHKVVFDFIDNTNWLIRGFDLITEDCLYRHYCEMFKIPIPKTDYVGRLIFAGDVVSKTKGAFKLKDLHDRSQEVLANLEVDCLTNPEKGWRVDNVKSRPVLGEWINAIRA